MKGPRPDLLRLAVRLANIVGTDRCLLVGGLAVAGHGYVRATDGIDVVVDQPLAQVRRKLAGAGIETELAKGDVLEGDFPCLRGTIEGIRFDVLPRLVPLDWEKGIEAHTESGCIRVVDLEGLLRLKLRAQGVQDLLDVAVLVLQHPELRERAREMGRAHGILDRLDAFLADRRTQATAEEQRARETSAPRPPRRRATALGRSRRRAR